MEDRNSRIPYWIIFIGTGICVTLIQFRKDYLELTFYEYTMITFLMLILIVISYKCLDSREREAQSNSKKLKGGKIR